jgi:hypothetical protein
MQFAESGVRRGSISSDDPIYAKLLLWTDANHDGMSEAGELQPFSRLFSDISLAYEYHRRRDENGNVYAYKGSVKVRTAPGRNRAVQPEEIAPRTRIVYDVYLRVQP